MFILSPLKHLTLLRDVNKASQISLSCSLLKAIVLLSFPLLLDLYIMAMLKLCATPYENVPPFPEDILTTLLFLSDCASGKMLMDPTQCESIIKII